MALNLPGNLNNTEGRIASNSVNMNISADTLTNTDGTLEHAGTSTLAVNVNTLNGTRGTIASNGALNLTATNATLNAATTTASQLNVNSATLSHQGGTMTQTGSGAATIAASTQLDNTGGTITSNGSATLNVGALKNQGGTIQATGSGSTTAASDLTLTATAEIDNSNAGNISASGNATIMGDNLNNTQGQITAGQTLSSTTTQATNNTQGLLAANGQVTLTASQINNQAGTIGSVQDAASVTAQTGALNNQAGRIEAAKTVTLSAVGITNTDGTVTGKSLSANSQSQSFNNTRGKLIASGAGGTDTLNVQSGALTNDSGLIQGASALTVNTHGQTLTNTNSGASGGIVGQSTVNLSTGDLNNQAGYIGSNAALTVNGATITNTQGGNIVSSAAATINANSLNNQGGQIQAVGNVDATLSGSLNNTGSLVRSGQNLTINAASVNNTNTQGSNQGLEGNNVSLSASNIDNTTGAIRANNNTTLISSGTINNTNGLVSAGNTLAVQDLAANKTLAITNTNGTLLAGQQLTVDSASLSGDGNVLSQGNLNVTLKQSITNSGQIIANGNATVETDATLTNQGTLAAGNTLNAKAATIDNQAGGTISATNVKLQATDSHTLTNRGTINGTDTVLETQTLNNLGTGKIYGDHVAIGATTLTNAAENGTAPVIAARDRLDIGADTINNSGHAIMFSGGDVAIGGSLDASKRATGQATTLNNDSATIEATGALGLNTKTVNNTNQNFSTTTENLAAQSITEYQGSGSPNRYTPGTPDVYVYNDESDHLHTPEGNYESWSAYNYTRNTSETRVASSDPAQILSGGAMRITADTVNNDKSRIIAGGTLTGTIGTLNNTEVAGERVTTDSGSVTSYWRDHHKGRDSTGSSSAGYNPAPTIQAISLTPTVYQQNTASSGSGTQVAALSTATVNQTPGAASSATGTTQGGQVITPITQVVAAVSSSASGPATVVRSGGINTSVPNNSLFGLAPGSTAHYLIETDPAFANYRTWLSSDYLLNALSLDPALTQKRLGDGFYEQKLIREQVAQLTGRRFLDGYANDEAQYAALMNSGVTFAQAYNLVPGIALSAAQMAQLTNDIVWLVEKDITLPNGTTTKALVPQLYVHVQEGDLQAGGALIAGNNVNLNVTGNLLNGGTIAGRQVVALTADNINNLGGRILGTDVGVAAGTDLNNIGGTIAANNNLVASAGRDLNVTSTTRTQTNAQGSQTNIERVAGLYVTGTGGTLLASATRDVNLNAAAIINAAPTSAGAPTDSTTITAGNNLNLGTVTQSQSNRVVWSGNNNRSDSSKVDIGTSIQTQGDLILQAGNDLNAKGANVTSTQGNLVAIATNNVNLTAGEANVQVDEAHQHKGRSSAFSSKTITTRDTLDQTTAQATTFSGKTTTVLADRDINLTGSNVVSDNGTTLAAQNNLNIAAATNTTVEGHFRDEKKSGIFSGGGLSITVGTQQQSVDQQGVTKTAAASTVGSTQGDINLQAGQNYAQTGSNVIAPQGNIDIGAKRIDIVEARDTSQSQTETKFKQSGLTVALTNPVVSAIQTADQMKSAASKTSDPRMQALALATTALAAKNAVDAVQANPSEAGGVNLSISVGTSKSQSNTIQTSGSAAGSTVAAGGNINMIASGAGQDSNLTIQGSTVKAGNNIALNAENEVKLLAAQNTADQHSTNKNSSASVGISIGTDGLLFTASASGGRGKADGSDVSWTNTHVDAGNQLKIQSGGDTTLKGAVATGKQVVANVGGSLNVESLQDTSKFDSKQQSIGGSISVGYGKMGGSINVGKSNINSDFASVTEQSGIRAEDDGFQITVANNTDLKGAVITSTDKAAQDGKNSLTTGSLTTSDIQNKAEYKGQSFNIGAGYSTGMGVGKDSQGNATTGGTQTPGTTLPSLNGFSATLPVAMSASGNASSTTQSGVSAAAISITNEAQQQTLTGKDAATTVASLNREVATGKDTSNALKPIFNEQEIKAGFEIVGAFANQVGTFLNNRAKEADAKTTQAKDVEQAAKDPNNGLNDEQRQALRDQAITLRGEAQAINDNWGAGGTYRQITTALVAGISGNVSAASSEFAKNMVVNYVQQQGASYIGQLVADGKLTEGSPLHAALHAIVACAGAAASNQSCGSGAAGAAASSLLTGLFSDTNPNETTQEREAKRNLIVSIVTGIASVGDANVATATNAAGATVDNNWLATQQIVQMKKEIKAAQGTLEELKVAGKWAYISTKQDVLTTAGVGKGLVEAGISDIKGLAEFLSDPIAGLNGLKQIITSPEARQQLGDSVFKELDAKIDRMKTALQVGGDQNAEQLGQDLGALVWQVGAVATGVGGVAKGGVALAKVGISVGKDVLEGMAVSKAYKLAQAEAIASAKQAQNFYRDGSAYSFPKEIKTTSGVVIKANPDKTTTILGAFTADTKRIINQELGMSKSMAIDGATQPGSFNLLNTPDSLYTALGPEKFWQQINKPFLDAAIARGDDIALATKPEGKVLISPKDPSVLSGFGREVKYLEAKGYQYDPTSGHMCLGGCK